MLEVHAILQRQRCNENITKKTGTLSDAYIYMTFEEAIALIERIKDQIVGAPVKGRLIESLFIGPTNWDEMHVFMNISLQKGEDEAINEFIGKSFSVYGRSVTYINPDLPRWDVTVLDDWEKTIYN